MKPFVFISYARSDGRAKAEELKNFLDRHDVPSFADWSNSLRVGNVLSEELQTTIASARRFVPVFTPGYAKGGVAVQEYLYAKQIGRKPKPVVFGFANAISWLRSGSGRPAPAWLGEKPVIIELGDTEEVRRRQLELLLREVSPSSYIIDAAKAASSIPAALALVATAVDEIQPAGA